MKKTVLLLITCLSFSLGVQAQGWKMVITKTDGTTQELLTADVKDITFTNEGNLAEIPDQNVDQIIIKELYCGGCPKDDGTSFIQTDKCIILYNNCPQQAVVHNLCFGMVSPYNSQASNKNYDAQGQLVYEAENFIPAINGIWYYPDALVFEPWSQIVINVHGAIDNTQTYSQSVNYANKDYYCMYDPESGYVNTSYYPTPADVIPTSHYLKSAKYGQGNAWPLSSSSPALFIYQPKDVAPAAHALNADNLWYSPGEAHDAIHANIQIPNEWIIDGVEVYSAADKEKNQKRLTSDIDAGYVYLTNKLGHALYRNVDKEETESLSENQGKLVYGYADDPSGIDAEASMKKGAHIVFLDWNDSSNDFHERQKCSLRE